MCPALLWRLATGGTNGVELVGSVVKAMSYGWKLPRTRKRLAGEYSQGKVKKDCRCFGIAANTGKVSVSLRLSREKFYIYLFI